MPNRLARAVKRLSGSRGQRGGQRGGSTKISAIVMHQPTDSSDVKVETIFPPDGTPIPDFVYVAEDDKLSKAKKSFEKGSILGFRIEIYSVSTTRAADGKFGKRFTDDVLPMAATRSTPFDVGVLYKFYGRTGRYMPSKDFVKVMAKDRADEVIYLATAMGAKMIVMDKKIYESLDNIRSGKFNLSAIPEHGIEASGNTTRTESDQVAATVTLERARPNYRPYIPEMGDEMRWFYDNGDLPTALGMEVALVERGGFPSDGGQLTVHFNHTHTHDRINEASLAVDSIIGVGITNEGHSKSEHDKTITIKFFDKEVLEKADVFTDRKARHNKGLRWSLSMLASLRKTNLLQEDETREDRKLAKSREAFMPEPSVEPVSALQVLKDKFGKDGLQAFMEGLGFGADGKKLTQADYEAALKEDRAAAYEEFKGGEHMWVPFVLYGPPGGGRTSVIFTFEYAIRGNIFSFLEGSRQRWKELRQPVKQNVKSFLRNVQFNPKEPVREAIEKPDDELVARYPEGFTASACFFDTLPAKDAYKNRKGRELPFGMRILVLRYDEVAKAINAKVDSPERKALVKQLEGEGEGTGLLGGGVVRDEEERDGDIARYPPFATVLTSREVVCKGDEYLDEVQEVIDAFKEMFCLTHVYAMKTFKRADETLEATFADGGDAMTKQQYCRAWRRTAINAISVLDSIITNLAAHELMLAQTVAERVKAATDAADAAVSQ